MITLPPSEQKLFNTAHASAYSVANSTEIGVYFKVTKSVKCLITQLWSVLKWKQQEQPGLSRHLLMEGRRERDQSLKKGI